HHGGGGDQGGEPSCGQNGELFRLGERMVHTGEQMVQEGQRLIEKGNVEEGTQLVQEGAKLEQQGAMLEAQAGQGGPVGLNPGGPMDPVMPAGFSNSGSYGMQFPGMSGFGGGYGQSCGCGQLSVNGNSVNTGAYTIAASTDNSGTLTVTD